MAKAPEPAPEAQLATELDAIRDAIERAEAGDRSALPLVRDAFEKFPSIAEVMGGDLAKQAIDVLIAAMLPKQLAAQESVRKQIADMRIELAGDKPSPLERLLVERIVVCWLHAYHADVVYGQAGSISITQAKYLLHQQDRAQRRYLAAIKALATIRRLAVPVRFDVSVAGKLKAAPAEGERGLASRQSGAVLAN